MSRPSPPFAADARRIVVIGTTGAGKTTLARELSCRLGVPHIELDALHWEPNWTPAETEVFRRRVSEALKGDRWVVDGGYSKVRELIWPNATDIVWLDYTLALKMWRLFRRTFRRSITGEELWNGNRERFRTGFLSRDSLFIWLLKTHWSRRRRFPEAFTQPEHLHLRVVRLRSLRQTKRWLAGMEGTDAEADHEGHT